MNLLYHIKNKEGSATLLPLNNKWINGVSYSLLQLKKGQTITFSLKNSEALIVTLSGAFRLTAKDTIYTNLGARANVFAGKAFSVYLRNAAATYLIKAEEKTELAFTQISLSKKEILEFGNHLQVITPHDVSSKTVGKKNWKRTVHTIIPPSFKAVKMIAGETLNPAGNWSSVPPHKHDTATKNETLHKEFYFYKINPANGFAYQRIYDNKNINENYCLKNNNLVVIPKGFHPICAAPGHTLYYLWVLVGNKRTVKSTIDKQFDNLK